ncbi:hypothetical protein ACWFRB_13470 [Rhodococcus sp. NPDC055112]
MIAYTLEELREIYPALDAHERGDWSALRQAHPTVDQARAVRNPHELVIEEGGKTALRLQRPFSPAARRHSEISAGLDRAQQIPPRFELVGLMGLDRVFSNTGRRPLTFRGDGYAADELRAEERKRLLITEHQQRLLDAEHQQMLDLAEYGGQPTGAVVFHLEEWTEYDGALACPVPHGLSARRIVRLVALASRVCHWCARPQGESLDDYLMVGSGITRVFPTCSSCRQRFDRGTDGSGLDWHIVSDDYARSSGWPSDEWL